MSGFTSEALPAAVRDFQPDWGIVLGSGLAAFANLQDLVCQVDYADIPGLPVSKVPGHCGRFLCATIGDHRVVMASGRVHLYEGYSPWEVTAGIRCLAAMGISKLILTNAAGTLNPDFAPGSWMMIHDHLNLTGASPLAGGPNFFDMSEIYSRRLRARFADVASAAGVGLREGVYAGVVGPQYETPAEIRMLRTLGADAVGMSTVMEAIQARALGLEVAGFSCLTNWAAGLRNARLNHQEVMETGRGACAVFAKLITLGLAREKGAKTS